MAERKHRTIQGRCPGGLLLDVATGASLAEELALGRVQVPDPLTRAERLARRLKIAVGEPMPDLLLKGLEGR